MSNCRNLLVMALLFGAIACDQASFNEQPLYLSLKKAKKQQVLLAEYSVKNNYPSAISAYSYLTSQEKIFFNYSSPEIQPFVLLIRTEQNIESKGKFLALNKQGQTGKVISTDSTYLILIENTLASDYEQIVLYEFAVEKPEEKYQLNMRDSLILEKIESTR